SDLLEKARNAQIDLRKDLEKKMDEAGIDLWVCPSTLGSAPRGIESTGDSSMNLPWTNAGLPAITIPVDTSSNEMPIGFQVVARYKADEQLITQSERLSHVFKDEAL